MRLAGTAASLVASNRAEVSIVRRHVNGLKTALLLGTLGGWSFSWAATRGDHVLCSRATDEAGDVQPLEVVWNLGGYENNVVQRVRVHVD